MRCRRERAAVLNVMLVYASVYRRKRLGLVSRRTGLIKWEAIMDLEQRVAELERRSRRFMGISVILGVSRHTQHGDDLPG
jgi:hypothetical protein